MRVCLPPVLGDALWQAVIAHELGHVKCEHGIWITLANLLPALATLLPVSRTPPRQHQQAASLPVSRRRPACTDLAGPACERGRRAQLIGPAVAEGLDASIRRWLQVRPVLSGSGRFGVGWGGGVSQARPGLRLPPRFRCAAPRRRRGRPRDAAPSSSGAAPADGGEDGAGSGRCCQPVSVLCGGGVRRRSSLATGRLCWWRRWAATPRR